MQYTENLELPLFETDDPVDLFSTYNEAMGTIDEAIEGKASAAELATVSQTATSAQTDATQALADAAAAQADATDAGNAAAAAGQTAMDARDNATIAIGDAAAADRKAMAAQTDATQALADAETAGQTATTADQKADQAITDAAAASALAQQAISSGLKVKKLSDDEVSGIFRIPSSSSVNGLLYHTSIFETFDSYVINLTPRVKLVSCGIILAIRSSFTLNSSMLLRTESARPYIPTSCYDIYNTFGASAKVDISNASTPNVKYNIEFDGSNAPTLNDSITISLNGIVTYDYDIDLGTDIA